MKQTSVLCGLLLVCISLSFTNASKILMICPAPSKSHHILCLGVVDTLIESNHEVTFINSFATNSKKYKEITVHELATLNAQRQMGFQIANTSAVEMMKKLNNWPAEVTHAFFSNPNIVDFFNDKSQKFDLIIFEYFMNEMFIGLGVRHKCPVMILSSVSLMTWLTTMTGNPLSVEIVPNTFTPYTTNMNLWQRVMNTLITTAQDLFGTLLMVPVQKKLYEQYMPEEAELVPYDDLKKHISMIIVNSHPSVGISRPLLPNTIEIGGYHISDPEPLPKELKDVIESAKHGVIYFSMGSNLKSSGMDMDMRKNILAAFSTFKETILWKFEEDLPDRPKNVIIRKWMPQSSILAHKNVKLFISHGGLLSCTEATYFGVPLLAIPIFGDQYHNANTMSEKGQGIILAYSNITEASLTWSIKEVITNPKYAETAKMSKQIFHDRPMKPRKLLAFYVDHVIRTKGAKYLSPPTLPRTSQLLLDVAAVILIPLTSIMFLFVFLCRKICCRSKSKQQSSVEKKNN